MSKDVPRPATADDYAPSPFHRGELAIQRRLGVSEKIDRFGRVGIRHFMPEQHREFFSRLAMFFIGSVDAHERPWASVLCGEPGFIRSPNERLLRFASAPPAAEDPFAGSFRSGAAVGGLGIELHSRRRNRVNGKLAIDPARDGFDIRIDQSFGNCAKYIHARRARFVRHPSQVDARRARSFTHFDGECATILARCDTFFIASRFGEDPKDPRHGVDVSHRGVPAGLLMALDDRTLRWPDYRGNFFFNTFGNIELDPRCGILIIDFDTSDTLQLTGTANILWEAQPPDHATLEGAQRMVEFRLEEGIHAANALPFLWEFLEPATQFANE